MQYVPIAVVVLLFGIFQRVQFDVIVQFRLVSVLITLGQKILQVSSVVLVPIESLDLFFPNHMLLRVVWYSLSYILDNRDAPNCRGLEDENSYHDRFRPRLRVSSDGN